MYEVIAILGPTASGKSKLAMDLAIELDGEIICADSRTIYKGMDIGTAKPTKADRELVTHHCLDIINPSETFSVAEFKELANNIIHDINKRKKVALLVGGSGLYLDSVLYDLKFRGSAENSYVNKSLEELQLIAVKKGLQPSNSTIHNKRHLAGYIAREGKSFGKGNLRANTIVLGLDVSKEALEQRIISRVEQMFERGFVEEVTGLLNIWPKDLQCFNAPGYRVVISYLEGDIDIRQAKEMFIRSHMQLAKKQKTWFKRNTDIYWITDTEEARALIAS